MAMTKNLVPVTVPQVTFWATRKNSKWFDVTSPEMMVPGLGFSFPSKKNLSSILLFTVISANLGL